MIFLSVFAARRASRGFRKITDAIVLRLPVAGTIATASVLAFITEYFSLLLHAGVDKKVPLYAEAYLCHLTPIVA